MSGEQQNPWGQAAMASSIRDRIYRLPDEKITLTPLPAQLCTPHFLVLPPNCLCTTTPAGRPATRRPGNSRPSLSDGTGSWRYKERQAKERGGAKKRAPQGYCPDEHQRQTHYSPRRRARPLRWLSPHDKMRRRTSGMHPIPRRHRRKKLGQHQRTTGAHTRRLRTRLRTPTPQGPRWPAHHRAGGPHQGRPA